MDGAGGTCIGGDLLVEIQCFVLIPSEAALVSRHIAAHCLHACRNRQILVLTGYCTLPLVLAPMYHPSQGLALRLGMTYQ